MEKAYGEKGVELVLPVDRRSRIKEAGDRYLSEVAKYNKLDGVEDEFLYDTPEDLKTSANNFEAQVKQWDDERSLSPSEICVACSVFRKARISAADRHFMELADWLGAKESGWKTRLHWRKKSYLTAFLLTFVGITTGYGTSVSRWLLSIAIMIIGFALLAGNFLDYGHREPNFGNALYWSIITISTVGYGDVTPKEHPIPQIIASAEAVIGLVMFIGLGMLIGEKVRRP